MSSEPDYNQLYETAESQAGYFTAGQAKEHGFSWERLSDNVKRGRFLRLFRGVYRLAHFPFQRMKKVPCFLRQNAPQSYISICFARSDQKSSWSKRDSFN